MKDQLINQLKHHEGYRKNIYNCTAGHRTIGYGYNLDANPQKLTQEQIDKFLKYGMSKLTAESLLIAEVNAMETKLRIELDFFHELDNVRQDVLINMAYNLGIDGLLKFKKTLSFIEKRQYSTSSAEMLNSSWADQVGNRAIELANQMATGKYANDK